MSQVIQIIMITMLKVRMIQEALSAHNQHVHNLGGCLQKIKLVIDSI